MKYSKPAAAALFFLAAFAITKGRAEISINPYPLGQQKSAGKPINLREENSGTSSYVSPANTGIRRAHTSDTTWLAFKGASAREVLELWSQDAGADVIWSTDEDFTVPQTIKMAGTYESAVESLLNGYQSMNDRPVGSLHVDPSSGKKTLVITIYEGN